VSAQIVRQARLLEEQVEFSIVFAAMGVKHDVAEFFIRNFRDSGALARTVMFFPSPMRRAWAPSHAGRPDLAGIWL
jgi:vacuolar-type H+-ATPase subunit B/Vma2